MDSEDQARTVFRFLTAIGNANILWHHIIAIEKDIIAQNEHESADITNTPHFAAWIRMLSKYVSNSLFDSYYQMQLNEEVYKPGKYGFGKIIKKIHQEHTVHPSYLGVSKGELKDIVDSVKIFVDLRNCFQHGGLPNIGRNLRYTTSDRINQLLNPKNFHSTKQLFMKAICFAINLPKQSVGF